MINSRDPKDLEAHVYANVEIGAAMCAAIGYPIGFDNTLRDQEYQTQLYLEGKAPQLVAFHAYGLAFDIHWAHSSTPYANKFYAVVAPIFKMIGFTWMYDIAGYDKCHFQWDNHRAITTTIVRAGRMPPPMPLYQEEDIVSKFIEDMATKYKTSTTEIERILEQLIVTQLHIPQQWEKDGELFLRTKGLTNTPHSPNELMTFGIYGALESRK